MLRAISYVLTFSGGAVFGIAFLCLLLAGKGYPKKEERKEVAGSGSEHWYWESDDWYYIDKQGNRCENQDTDKDKTLPFITFDKATGTQS